MKKAPQAEPGQVEELWSLNVLDTPPEERYDRITRIAQTVFDVPIVLVSLLGECRQWFKSKQGLSVSETAREISFCGHLESAQNFLEIHDALKDKRFFDNPLVTGPPNIRFYAGQALRGPSKQHILGTLCLVDSKPRKLSDREKELLCDLAGMVEHELAAVTLCNEMSKLRGRQQDLYEYFDGSTDLIQSLDTKGNITYVNHGWLERLGYTLNSLPSNILDVIAPAFHIDYSRMMKEVLSGIPSLPMEVEFVTSSGEIFPAKGYALCARELGRDVVRGTFRDVSIEQKQQERLNEKATTDHLTGLLNRRGFEERVALALHDMKVFESYGCLAMVDVDDLKRINDTSGHLVGDQILQDVSKVISTAIPKTYAVGRWGGDEISILLPKLKPDSARTILEHVRELVAKECGTTISIGIGKMDANKAYSAAFEAADRALYKAKTYGRNNVKMAR